MTVNGSERPVRDATKPQLISGKIAIVLDSTKYDPGTQTYALSMRVRNLSRQTIRGPLTVAFARSAKHGYEGAYTILTGDRMDYSQSLGTLGRLKPGEASDAAFRRVWSG